MGVAVAAAVTLPQPTWTGRVATEGQTVVLREKQEERLEPEGQGLQARGVQLWAWPLRVLVAI